MINDKLAIDFVLIWVDNNDPKWRKSFIEHLSESKKTDDTREVRYRDWGLLPYWFRGVERFAPWVNKIHFITCGHYPEWLNLKHPKLNFVQHKEYMPEECLPTFNSNPIELYLHRIKELSEYFVLFNDDFFIINNISPGRFFRHGLPCDIAAFDVIASTSPSNKFAHIILNNISVINQKFRKFEVLKSNKDKWFNWKYGINIFRNLALLPWPYFTGFINPHLPYAYLKSTLNEVWNHYDDLLSRASLEKFRSENDYSHWLFRYWQLVRGNFYPFNVYQTSVYYEISKRTIAQIEDTIRYQKKAIVVLNDVENESSIQFEEYRERILALFQIILPEKSSFEK